MDHVQRNFTKDLLENDHITQFTYIYRELIGRVLYSRQRGHGLSLTGVTALCPLARHIYPSLALVQPRKICPFITERLLMGCKESNQTNKTYIYSELY